MELTLPTQLQFSVLKICIDEYKNKEQFTTYEDFKKKLPSNEYYVNTHDRYGNYVGMKFWNGRLNSILTQLQKKGWLRYGDGGFAIYTLTQEAIDTYVTEKNTPAIKQGAYGNANATWRHHLIQAGAIRDSIDDFLLMVPKVCWSYDNYVDYQRRNPQWALLPKIRYYLKVSQTSTQ